MNPSQSPADTPASPSRRGLWLGAAGSALLAGAGWAWWRGRQNSASGRDPALELDGFRQLVLPGADGQALALAQFHGRPLLVNFWATWCPPCVREFPALDRFAQSQGPQGWQVLALAIDQPAAVAGFLQRQPVRFPVATLGPEGLRWVRLWGNAAGGLPFTVGISSENNLLHRKFGETTLEELSRWVPT